MTSTMPFGLQPTVNQSTGSPPAPNGSITLPAQTGSKEKRDRDNSKFNDIMLEVEIQFVLNVH